ncbi:6-pyruvoyl tetrahydropterin synthase (plasmid) [Streptomyces alboflavus]|uniref:6-carboxy-5,6,7,8-tetrahydropterin synthase n=1 Tax=Streptomyces alboflavus TaxID=67267 RepID=A0A291W3Y0_9ACTN|nr:6-carboxytetrahydropterin synthase [Streptomyces alboflavus]ATM24617.1 6-pyruvoyl tetrahydropterin synthase [Streptomyces alboflavus]
MSDNVPTVGLPPGSFTIGKSFSFEAGHQLPGLPIGHKCARGHGHSYRVEVILTCGTLAPPGFVTDFGDLSPFKDFIDEHLDHRNLHEVLPVEPTAELIAQYLAGWFLQHLEPALPGRLMAVCVYETATSWARFDVVRNA